LRVPLEVTADETLLRHPYARHELEPSQSPRLSLTGESLASPFCRFLFSPPHHSHRPRANARATNLLAVMENDLAGFFLLLEYALSHWSSTSGHPPLIDDGMLQLGEDRYDRLVLTPLMMDFGSKNIPRATYYRLPPQKPIVEQVVDLFHGIATYRAWEMTGDNRRRLPLFPVSRRPFSNLPLSRDKHEKLHLPRGHSSPGQVLSRLRCVPSVSPVPVGTIHRQHR